jgi:hypothetical protein
MGRPNPINPTNPTNSTNPTNPTNPFHPIDKKVRLAYKEISQQLKAAQMKDDG